MEHKLVVFDLDGTLFQTHITSVQAIKAALIDFSLPVADDDFILSLTGYQMEEVCSRLAPDSDKTQQEQLANRITFHEKRFVETQGRLFDGIENMLIALKDNGYTLAICSNGKQEYVETVLSVCNISQHFSAVRGKKLPMSKTERLKELIEEFSPPCVVFVGDRIHDFEAARDNRIKSIGVTFGYGGDEIDAADYTANSGNDIVRIVKELAPSTSINC